MRSLDHLEAAFAAGVAAGAILAVYGMTIAVALIHFGVL